MEEQIDKLEQEMASLLRAHQNVVQRLAEGSSRQGCESCGVRVPVPPIACIRAASISNACEVTKHALLGRKSLSCPAAALVNKVVFKVRFIEWPQSGIGTSH